MSSSAFQRFSTHCEWLSLFLLTMSFFVLPISVGLTSIAYVGAFVLLLFSNDWSSRWTRIRHNMGALSFWILVALFLIGVLYTTSTMHLVWQDLHKRHWMLFTPFFVIILINEVWRQRMVNAFLCAITVIVCISYFKIISHVDIYRYMSFAHPQRGAGVFMDYIAESLVMNIAAFICGYRCLFEKKCRWFYALLFVLIGVNVLFLSLGRTGYGTFILLLIYLALIRFGWKGVISSSVIAFVLLGAAFLLSNNFQSRVTSIYIHYKEYKKTSTMTSEGQRMEMISIAKRMIAERPWFGYGTGGIRTELQKMIPAHERVFNPSIDYIENIYLNFLLEFGVFGLLVLIAVIAMQIKTSMQLPQQYRYLFQAVLIAILFGGCFNPFFVSFVSAHLYALFSALCLSAHADNQHQSM